MYRNCQFISYFSKYSFLFSTQNRPAVQKAKKGGEDAWYASKQLLSVADGVSQWNEFGFDPAKYSRKLMSNLDDFIQVDREIYLQEPKQLLIQIAKYNYEIGSSTCIILTINPKNDKLRVANMGDSGFILFRKQNDKYELIYKSEEQQHLFNQPFQVGTEGDSPELADQNEYEIQEDDLIIVGSDGLFDNLFDEDIQNLINENYKQNCKLNCVGQIILDLTFKKSLDVTYNSPFAQHSKENNLEYMGGKPDDITFIISKVILNKNYTQYN